MSTMAGVSVSAHTLTFGWIILGLYMAFAIIYNLCFTMRPSWNLLNQTLKGIRERLRALDATGVGPAAALAEALAGVTAAEDDLKGPANGDRHWYSRSRENPWFMGTSLVQAVWRRAHELEIAYWKLAPVDLLQQRLYGVREALVGMPGAESRGVIRRIDEYKRQRRPAAEARPLLVDAMRVYYDQRDTVYDSLTNQQTTGAWLTLLGLALIALSACMFQREPLLLFGALGGFLSRVWRLLRRRPGAKHFGVSAVVFMLAPVVGSLSGFAGVAIAQGLANLNVLSAATFKTVWDHPHQTTALTLAFAFGFVERLIDNAANLAAGTLKSPTAGAPGAGNDTEPLPSIDDSSGDDQSAEAGKPARSGAPPPAGGHAH
jgi:hypothetical protein